MSSLSAGWIEGVREEVPAGSLRLRPGCGCGSSRGRGGWGLAQEPACGGGVRSTTGGWGRSGQEPAGRRGERRARAGRVGKKEQGAGGR